MKKLQQFCAAVVLMMVFTFSVFAGDVSYPGDVQPPPPPLNQTATTGEMNCPDATATGDMQTSGASAVDPVTEATLSLLQNMLSVF
ncbi:MAG: hypothetical protein DMF68_20815 [Acidobacteria bacterium]|nr:MAG: hypothetical protein DMF68_20815 [Acidobacteriota bacterium]